MIHQFTSVLRVRMEATGDGDGYTGMRHVAAQGHPQKGPHAGFNTLQLRFADGAPGFHFALGSTNYVAGCDWKVLIRE